MSWGDGRLSERFWAKVQPCPMSGCWLWSGATGAGYGKFNVGAITKSGNRRGGSYAHRVAYEALVGEIEPGLHLDHKCRVTVCVNPAHVEPVSCKENVLRGTALSAKNATKTHCPNGHDYSTNSRRKRKGRDCAVCHRERNRRAYAARTK